MNERITVQMTEASVEQIVTHLINMGYRKELETALHGRESDDQPFRDWCNEFSAKLEAAGFTKTGHLGFHFEADSSPVVLHVPIGDHRTEVDLMRALDFVCQHFQEHEHVDSRAIDRAVDWLKSKWWG